MHRYLKKRTFGIIVMCILFVFLSILPAKANDKKDKVVRVGYPLMDGLSMKDEDGNYYGYNYDYLMQIAQYTGWEYEFVEVKGDVNQRISKLMEMLKNGEIDLMGDIKYIDSYAEQYDYASEPYGNAYNVIAVRDDSALYDVNGLLNKKNLKIGILKTASKRAELLNQYAQSNGLTFEEVLCEDEQDISNKLENKEIDAFLHVDISLLDGCRSIARFSPDPFFFITTKGNSQIMSELNVALNTIDQINPTFPSTIYNRYFNEGTTDISLNDEEKKYLEKHSKINVLICDGFAPFQYFNDKANGIATDILDKLSKDKNIKFNYIYAKNYKEYKELANSNNIDMAVSLPYEIKIANKMNMTLSEPFLSSNLTLVTYKGIDPSNLSDLKQATTFYDLSMLDTNKNRLTYQTPEQALKAVNQHEVDYTYISSYMYTYYMNKYAFKHISSYESPDYLRTQYAYGVKKSKDLTLLSILNKVIRSQTSEINNYVYKNAYVEKEFVLSSFVSEHFSTIIISVTIVLISILYLVHAYYKKQLRMKKAVEIEYRRYQMLSDMSKEMTFSYDYLRDCLKVSSSGLQRIAKDETIEHFSTIDITNPSYPGVLQILHRYLLEKNDVLCESQTKLLNNDLNWYQIIIKIIRDDTDKDNEKAIYAVGKVIDIQKEKLEKEQLRIKSETDNLTNILNRGAAEKIITNALENGQGNGALLILDIDNFKNVNDEFGHMEGDKVLIETARILSSIFLHDTVSRLGGDEFIVYIQDIDDESLQALCEETVDKFHQLSIKEDMPSNISVSIGVIRTSYSKEYMELFKKADENLYKVKRNGRNNYLIS